MLSSPAIMRSRVDLPHPEGTDQHDEFAVADADVHAVDHLRGTERFLDVADSDRRHSSPPSYPAGRMLVLSAVRVIVRGPPKSMPGQPAPAQITRTRRKSAGRHHFPLDAAWRMRTLRRLPRAVRRPIKSSIEESVHARRKADVVMFGPKPIIEEALDEGRLARAQSLGSAGPGGLHRSIAPKVRAIAAVAGHGPVDGAMMARFPRLEIVSSFGVGYDHIDAKWAGEHGIVVTNTPDVLNEEVADTALGLLLCTVRHLPQAERYLRAGNWPKHGDYQLTPSLRDRTAGIVGMGPHRQGDRAPARRHAGAGGLPHAPADRRRLPALSEPHRHGARRRRADRDHAGRRGDEETWSTPRCSRRSGPTAS
jgi:hypothetical protein